MAKELSCKDLMIGDWVMINPISYYQVEQIGMEFGELRTYLKSTGVFATENEIMPVPLTPEILEKNGFRIIFDGELHVSYFRDIEGFHIEVKVDKVGIYQKLTMFDGLGNGVTIVKCKYVHQLQRALRLCGISKQIEL